jgi:chemotaxis signal transduction protein
MNTSTSLRSLSEEESISNTTEPAGNRFILAQVMDKTIAIPAVWVAEILRVERKKILSLPFYQDLVLGVIHQSGKNTPLLSVRLLLGGDQVDVRETLTVVRLGALAGDVVEVGLVVDQVVRSVMQFELPVNAIVFDLQMMQLDLWRPCI